MIQQGAQARRCPELVATVPCLLAPESPGELRTQPWPGWWQPQDFASFPQSNTKHPQLGAAFFNYYFCFMSLESLSRVVGIRR